MGWSSLVSEEHKDSNFHKAASVILTVLPISILFMGFQRNMKDDGKCVKWRPDGWTYIVVWVLIVIGIIIANILTIRNCSITQLSIVFTVVTIIVALAIAWIPVYAQNRKTAISIFIFITFLTLMLIIYTNSISPLGSSLYSPLLVWLIVQFYISAEEFSCR